MLRRFLQFILSVITLATIVELLASLVTNNISFLVSGACLSLIAWLTLKVIGMLHMDSI